jgi:hypothetical protein
MDKMPSTSKAMKNTYCQGNYSSCARHMVFIKLSKDEVPNDLFPHQQERAKEFLKNQKQS